MSSFATTRWTLVLAAGETDIAAKAALEELCQIYWSPLYYRARREGLSTQDAEDAVQGYFARLLRLESLASVRPERGSFRSFLLGSFKHFLSDQRDRARASKRDVRKLVNLNVSEVESSLDLAADGMSPDAAFDREWAKLLLNRVITALASEQEAAGKGAQFSKLAPCLAGRNQDLAHADLAQDLDMSEAAIRVALHRLRQRYRLLLREEIAQTIANPSEIDNEIRHLMSALS